MTQPPSQPEGNPSLFSRLLAPLIESIAPAVEHGTREVDPFRRDPDFIRSLLPLIQAADWYFDAEVRCWENIPTDGPCLIVGNHSGGAQPMDMWPFFIKWAATRGVEEPFYALTYDLNFGSPWLSRALLRMGCIPASHDNARKAFEQNAPVIVFPGGDHEVFRPWGDRNRIDFDGRKGFIKLALSAGVPIVPMTIHGAHESTFVLSKGRRLAHMIGLNDLNVGVLPFVWNIPFGVTPAFVPSIQLPSKVTVEMGAPLSWDDLGPDDASDSDCLDRCYEDVTSAMQQTMDRLAGENPYPILTRLSELRPDKVVARSWHALWD
jgi:1-acyl-sn-glycerol-3-phosphate acyltransferase